MFTGLIEELGEIAAIRQGGEGARLSVKSGELHKDAAIGDSIAINGICLTVIDIKDSVLSFDVSSETLKSTNLGGLKTGDKVNLESSLRPTSRMGGHFVTGHIDGIGKIRSKTQTGNAIKIEIEAQQGILKYLVEKGSVAVDGISLTVVDVMRDSFTIVIIPHTAKMTTVGFKNSGDTVNLEPDILAKYVAKFLKADGDSSLMAALKKSGFM